MNAKKTDIMKKIVDACMTVLLLCLMAYQATGEALHEWFGIGMTVLLIAVFLLFFTGEKQASDASRNDPATQTETTTADVQGTSSDRQTAAPTNLSDGFPLIEGGSFLMGSPETENRRIDDETQHEVTVIVLSLGSGGQPKPRAFFGEGINQHTEYL